MVRIQKQILAVIVFAFLVILLSFPVNACAEYVTASIHAGANPMSIAVNPATNKIYVLNYDSQSVTGLPRRES
jgi:hypothetical protein